MAVRPDDHMWCKACNRREYCTLFLQCEMCGHVDPDHVEYRKKKGWHREPILQEE